MRKLIWCWTALAVLATAGVLLATRHAVLFPESFLGRCGLALTGLLRTRTNAAPARNVADQPVAQGQLIPLAEPLPPMHEPIEPIVVDQGSQEPPVAQPALPPEIAAAIVRLRDEEESELPVPVMPFCEDDVNGRPLRMPYADEDAPGADPHILRVIPLVDVLRAAEELLDRLDLFKVAETPRPDIPEPELVVETKDNQEAAEDGSCAMTQTDGTGPEMIPQDHLNSCPYHGGCPYPYYYR